jgi:hypothetical protein
LPLDSKHALITGSSRGIGRGVALESYLRGPILGNIQHQAGVCDLSLKTFDTLNEIALITLPPSLHRGLAAAKGAWRP